MSSERVTFPGSTGATLAGVFHRPHGDVRGSVLLAHCFTCSKDLHTMTRLSRGLVGAGYAVLRFDFAGIGESGGDFSRKTVSRNVGDIVAAARMLIERGFGPCALLGHSLGGAATLLAANRLKAVRLVAVIGAPACPDHVRRLLSDHEEVIRRDGEAVVEIAGRPFPVSLDFLDDLARHDEAGEVARLGRPLMVVHAVDDRTVSIDEGERIFAAARHPKAFVSLPDADHLLTTRSSAEAVLRLLVAWFDVTR